MHTRKIESKNGKKGNDIGRLLVAEFKENETRLFNEIMETIFYKGIMPSEKVLDFPVDCNTLTGSVNL